MIGARGTGQLAPEQRPRSRKMTRRAQPYRRKGLRPNGPTLTAMLRGAPMGLPNPADMQRTMQRRARRGR